MMLGSGTSILFLLCREYGLAVPIGKCVSWFDAKMTTALSFRLHMYTSHEVAEGRSVKLLIVDHLNYFLE
jgi:hypothetical protein